MNKYQALVNGVYGDGWEIAEFSAEPSHDGDTLAQYVARELSDSEECHSVDDAIQRIGTAIWMSLKRCIARCLKLRRGE